MMKLIQSGLIISLMTFGASSRKIKVFKTANNIENFKNGSGAKLRNVRDFELVDFSVCYRFFFFVKYDGNTLIHSKHDQDTILNLVTIGPTTSL